MKTAFLAFLVLLQINNIEALSYEYFLDDFQSMVARISRLKTVSCRNKCEAWSLTKERHKKRCYCDENCETFKDCCADYWQSCNASFTKANNQPGLYKCLQPKLSVTGNIDLPSLPISIETIATCPANYHDTTIRRLCEDTPLHANLSLLFVQSITSNTTYKNHHCARCRGEATWKVWQTKLNCRDTQVRALIKERMETGNYTFNKEERQLLKTYCYVQMIPPANISSSHTSCWSTRSCTNTSSPDYKACLSYQFIVGAKKIVFPPVRNLHCARCAGIAFNTLTYRLFLHGDKGQFAYLFDFSKATEIYEKPSKSNENEIHHKNATDNCEWRNITYSNTSNDIIMFENNSVFVRPQKMLYSSGEYRRAGSDIILYTCVVSNNVVVVTVIGSTDVVYILTVVGFAISMPALVLVLSTYTIFRELRTVPGKIIMNLTIAVFFSQLMMLISLEQDVSSDVCWFIAVLLHYLYLASFCWMNAIAFDMARTFARKSHNFIGVLSSTRHRLFQFSLFYAWGTPLTIVSLTMLIDQSQALHVGYGNDYYCWITNPVALAIFFAGPVALMLLYNIVALVKILLALRHERKATKRVRRHSTLMQDIGICWKLTIVFGLTWLLAFGAGYHMVLKIAHVVCNSLQGVCIMVGFVLTKRVVNLYLKKAGREPWGKKRSKSTTTTTTTASVTARVRTISLSQSTHDKTQLIRETPSKRNRKKKSFMSDQVWPESEPQLTINVPETPV